MKKWLALLLVLCMAFSFAACTDAGIRIRTLSSYYHGPVPADDRRCLVVNYAALPEEELERALKLLLDMEE